MAASTKALNGKTANPSSEDLAKQIEILQKDLGQLTQTIAEIGKSKSDAAVSATKAKLSDARDHVADQAETAKLQAMELQGQANDFIRNQPATALGVAAGLGFLVGIMSTRK
ncbi:DUF883 domain-containing protein [Yoonia sp. SS1-5]|uniref:YqjD family protein n=1 Tax=Yoonia rhodophyticola TaxID=3137370 RepID=A0AAN0NLV8_9RHOB